MKELFWSHLNYERVSMPSAVGVDLEVVDGEIVDAREQQDWPPPYRAHNTPDPATPGP